MPDQFIETDSGLFMARRRILAGGALGGIALAAMGAGVANAASLLSPGKDAGAQKISFRNPFFRKFVVAQIGSLPG